MDLNTLTIPQNNPVTLYVKGLYVNNIPITGGGASNALVQAEIAADIIPYSMCLFTGENKFDCISDSTITIDQNTHLTTINNDLVVEGSASIKNGNIIGLYSSDNSNACSIQCDDNGDLNLNSEPIQSVNVNNNLNVGKTITATNIISNGDIRIHNTPANPKFSFLAMNEDDGLDIVNHNVGGQITFSTLEYTRTLKQLVEDIDKLKEIITNLTGITFN